MYDIASSESFENLSHWAKLVQTNTEGKVLKVVIGNKADLKESRCVSKEMGKQFAEKVGAMFMEMSARTGANVLRRFLTIVQEVMTRKERMHNGSKIPSSGVNVDTLAEA